MEFRLPQRSGDYEYSTIQSWLKRVGDRVEAGEPLVEVETDKATEEVEAPVGGTIADILAELAQTGGYAYPESQTPWQEIQRGLADELSNGMVLKPAVKYQRIAHTKGLPRHNH